LLGDDQPSAVNDLATPSIAAVGPAHDLLLKVTAPRVPRHQIVRPRLQASGEAFRDRPVILVQAPAGYGKTSLLAQWRREHLAHGAVVAWLSVQADDDPQRLVQGLVLAVRSGAPRANVSCVAHFAPPPGVRAGMWVYRLHG